MFLERLILSGFKSFANKTVLEFPQPKKDDSFGITAIVGPNGSGKSNIVEAVRWGLGEQSMKTLRSKKTADVIFSGSDQKSRMSVAEVSLAFNNEDHAAPIDYREFTISRKFYRNKEGEYLLNKSRIRLQDILVLLAKSNVGQKSYSIIGQGMIDQILHSSESERKLFFDEATGVKQYQIKKDEALRKLERTSANLKQAEIALQEITPRMRSLTRQIKKLERHDGVEKELRDLQKKYYSSIRFNLLRQQEDISSQLKNLEEKENKLKTELETMQNKIKLAVHEDIESKYKKIQEEQKKLIQLKNEFLEKQAVLKGKITIEQEKLTQIKEKGVKIKIDLNKLFKYLTEISQLHQEFIKKLDKIYEINELGKIKKESLNVAQKIESLINYFEKPETPDVDSTIPRLETESRELITKISQINQDLENLDKKLSQITTEEQNKRKDFYNLQKDMQDEQFTLNKLSNEINNLKINLARVETKREDLEEEIKREMGVAGEEFMKSASAPTNLGAAADAQSANKIVDFEQIGKLKHQLDLIGGIDPEITKEYPECRERWEFLSVQTKDLKGAINSLNKIVNELDKKIKDQFNSSFKKINEKFDYYFKIFFKGGKAKLILLEQAEQEESEENLEISETNDKQPKEESAKIITGINIVAIPPGKRLKNIEALSGGEKALASLALICAIIAINKPPFVILDEVDAALDEENSHRFANILKDLSNKTQFIVVTHNRQTMEAANILYGVTMGKDGISKLLSIKLEEAVIT